LENQLSYVYVSNLIAHGDVLETRIWA